MKKIFFCVVLVFFPLAACDLPDDGEKSSGGNFTGRFLFGPLSQLVSIANVFSTAGNYIASVEDEDGDDDDDDAQFKNCTCGQ